MPVFACVCTAAGSENADSAVEDGNYTSHFSGRLGALVSVRENAESAVLDGNYTSNFPCRPGALVFVDENAESAVLNGNYTSHFSGRPGALFFVGENAESANGTLGEAPPPSPASSCGTAPKSDPS